MKFRRLLIGLLLFVFVFLFGCSGKQSYSDTRPKIKLFVCKQFPMDLRTYSELDRLILTHFDYEIITLGGGYDRLVAQTDYEKRRKLPYWNKAISFEEYLMLRDDGLRLHKKDIEVIEKYDLQQTPMIIAFDYKGQETGRFTKMRSDEISIRVSASVAKGKMSVEEANEAVETGRKLSNKEDRQILYSWLSDRVIQ